MYRTAKKMYCIKNYPFITPALLDNALIKKGTYFYLMKGSVNLNQSNKYYNIYNDFTCSTYLGYIKLKDIDEYFVDDVKYKLNLLLNER